MKDKGILVSLPETSHGVAEDVTAPIEILTQLKNGDRKVLARAITQVENELEGYRELLFALAPNASVPIIGFTGPPGAGKSTLINGVLKQLSDEGLKVAVVAVDPTSPFNYGSLLGDRLRMAEHFTNPDIFIRSLAARGSLGGLSEKIIEIVDVLRAADFDCILVETVGVGQSEVEIAGLADTTVVVVVPESGDEVQTLKSGIMEIADIFVVNKSDREGADALVNSLNKLMVHPKASGWKVPVIKSSAMRNEGVTEIVEMIRKHRDSGAYQEKKSYLLAEKAYRLIQQKRMRGIKKGDLREALAKVATQPDFNLYRFADQFNS